MNERANQSGHLYDRDMNVVYILQVAHDTIDTSLSN